MLSTKSTQDSGSHADRGECEVCTEAEEEEELSGRADSTTNGRESITNREPTGEQEESQKQGSHPASVGIEVCTLKAPPEQRRSRHTTNNREEEVGNRQQYRNRNANDNYGEQRHGRPEEDM